MIDKINTVKRTRIYLDTSVISGVYDNQFSEATGKLFNEIEAGFKTAVISDLTLDELSDAPDEYRPQLVEPIESLPSYSVEYVETTEEMTELATAYLNAGVITQRFRRDALHIAIATVTAVDVLVSWNFKHIVNLAKIRQYNSVNMFRGYALLEIRSPLEVLDED
jgi:predicted nucleic acid-binding protein